MSKKKKIILTVVACYCLLVILTPIIYNKFNSYYTKKQLIITEYRTLLVKIVDFDQEIEQRSYWLKLKDKTDNYYFWYCFNEGQYSFVLNSNTISLCGTYDETNKTTTVFMNDNVTVYDSHFNEKETSSQPTDQLIDNMRREAYTIYLAFSNFGEYQTFGKYVSDEHIKPLHYNQGNNAFIFRYYISDGGKAGQEVDGPYSAFIIKENGTRVLMYGIDASGKNNNSGFLLTDDLSFVNNTDYIDLIKKLINYDIS